MEEYHGINSDLLKTARRYRPGEFHPSLRKKRADMELFSEGTCIEDYTGGVYAKKGPGSRGGRRDAGRGSTGRPERGTSLDSDPQPFPREFDFTTRSGVD
jgi:hypothetical protein